MNAKFPNAPPSPDPSSLPDSQPSPDLQALVDCYGDPELLPADEARRRIHAAVRPVQTIEQVHLRFALDRVLAEDVVSPMDVPGFTNSAMDGFALSSASLPVGTGTSRQLRVLGTAWAGKPFTGRIAETQSVRIMTGAVMPEGADTVVMQEHVDFEAGNLEGGQIRIGAGHQPGQNVRQAGEDLQRGSVVLKAGHRIMPAELGLLASLGICEVKIRRKLRVATFSTGDELRSLGETLEPGQLYDSNRYTLFAMLSRLGVEVIDLGVVPDRKEAVHEAFKQAAACADTIITTGGASASEADFVAQTLTALGQVGFWRIAIRPGRPLAFGTIGDAFVFGLPGNPVAVMVTFYQFVQPALRALMGEHDPRPLPMLKARAAERLRKKPGRVEYYRAVLQRDMDNVLTVSQTGKSGSALLHTMSDANCFIVLPEESDSIDAGSLVDVQPFFGLV